MELHELALYVHDRTNLKRVTNINAPQFTLDSAPRTIATTTLGKWMVHFHVWSSPKCWVLLYRPCGCPDCSKPHPHGWQHGYCNSYDSSVSSDGSSYYVDSDGTKYYDDGSTGGAQGSRRSYYMWLAAAIGGSAAMAGTAFAMRKRVSHWFRMHYIGY